MSAALKLSNDSFSHSGARVRTTAAPVSRGVCIMSDNVLAGWSVLTDRQLVHYPIRNGKAKGEGRKKERKLKG